LEGEKPSHFLSPNLCHSTVSKGKNRVGYLCLRRFGDRLSQGAAGGWREGPGIRVFSRWPIWGSDWWVISIASN
jgi:hypothetical protein